jgi:hypothetical protein
LPRRFAATADRFDESDRGFVQAAAIPILGWESRAQLSKSPVSLLAQPD